MNNIDETYEVYKMVKNLIEKTEACCEKDHSNEPMFEEWKKTIKIFDCLGREYAERYEKEKKATLSKNKEQLAFDDLKNSITTIMFEFTDKYSTTGEDCIYPKVGNVLVDVLVECLSEAQYQIKGHPAFTSKQIDHICFQIGDWYFDMKPLLKGQHNLGRMKERLKIRICGE